MKYLSKPQVVELHDLLIQEFGGLTGIRENGLLESSLAAPMMTMFGEELHKSVYDKAAAYLYHMTRNHPFCDGNKRTATASSLLFLRLNGENPSYETESFLAFVITIAEGKTDICTISHYLKKLCT